MGCSGSKEAVSTPPPQFWQSQPAPAYDHPQLNQQGPLIPLQPLSRVQASSSYQGRQHPNTRANDVQASRSPQTPSYGWQIASAPLEEGPYSSPESERSRTAALGQWPRKVSKPGVGFDVYVWHHLIPTRQLDPVPGWTYISHGLENVQQPEVIFTLRQRRSESDDHFPLFPMEWIRVVYEFARVGIHMEEGQMCQVVFGNPVRFILNRREVTGDYGVWQNNTQFTMFTHALYASALPAGIPLPHARQLVVALKPEEAAVALEFGVTRVIGHLGVSVRWFPQPPWIDRDRDNCCTMADQTSSVRKQLKIGRIPGVNALLVNDDIRLTFPPGEAKKSIIQAAFKDLSEAHIFGFDSFMSHMADGGLTWKTGQAKELRGYGADG
jgi:hypothetical protein